LLKCAEISRKNIYNMKYYVGGNIVNITIYYDITSVEEAHRTLHPSNCPNLIHISSVCKIDNNNYIIILKQN